MPANPGTPLIQLYVASIAVAAPASAATTLVSYASASVAAWTQNGSNGSTGVQAGVATVYQWAVSIPSGPIGAGSYTWSSGTFGAAPSGWALAPGTGTPGYTLWAAKVALTDSAANTATAFNWSVSAISAAGYAGLNGSNGTGSPGAPGSSYVAAYCASSTASTTTTPAATSGFSSVPAANDGGIAGTWQKTVPALSSGQFMYQSDGIYNASTGQVTWSIPYWSSLKVGSLSAISANIGAVTSGTITGALIQTAASGQRVVINEGGANSLRIYSGAGTQVGEFGGFGGAPLVTSAGASIPGIQATCASASTAAIIASASAGNAILASASGGASAAAFSGSGTGVTTGGLFSSSSGSGIKVAAASGTAISISSSTNSLVVSGTGPIWTANVYPATDNAHSLGVGGGFRYTALYAMSSTITTSDERAKTDVQDSDLGLDFILALRAVKGKYIVGENVVTMVPGDLVEVPGSVTEIPGIVTDDDPDPLPIVVQGAPIMVPSEPVKVVTSRPGNRYHYMLLAQQVRAAMLASGVSDASFWSLADPADPASAQALRYEGLIAPLIKAIQEQNVSLTALRVEVDALKAEIYP